jgi:hypothetical protein
MRARLQRRAHSAKNTNGRADAADEEHDKAPVG